MLVFFFFKQKTAYEMRISDWSSDVCSSDLLTLFLDAFCVFETEDRDPIGRRRKDYESTAGAEDQIDSRDAHGDHNVVERGSNVSCQLVSQLCNGCLLVIEHQMIAKLLDRGACDHVILDRKSTRLNSSH